MKKFALTMIMCLSTVLFVGCNNKVQSLRMGDIANETILVRSNGTIQSAANEDFEKDYYDEKELKAFMEENVEYYNSTHEKDAVKITKVKVDGNKAKAIFTYKDLETYCELNGMEAHLYTMEEADAAGILPDKLVNASDNSDVEKESVLKHSDLNVFAISAKMDIMLPNNIMYYVNGAFLSPTKLEASGEGLTVIVYK